MCIHRSRYRSSVAKHISLLKQLGYPHLQVLHGMLNIFVRGSMLIFLDEHTLIHKTTAFEVSLSCTLYQAGMAHTFGSIGLRKRVLNEQRVVAALTMRCSSMRP